MARKEGHKGSTPGPVALVLGAGGTKGWAHVGVLRSLHEAGVPIDLIVGASAGALIGPLYAVRRDAAAMERIALSFTTRSFTDWFLRGLRIGPDSGRMARRLWQAYGRYDFQEMAIPFASVAHDLATGRRLVLREGLVAPAVEASIRPPILGPPTRADGRWLVDGGLQSAVPTDVALDLGAAVVIAVNVGELFRLPRPIRPLSAKWGRSLRRRAARPDGLECQIGLIAEMVSRPRVREPRPQVEIRPDMRGITALSPWAIELAAERGEAAARRALPAIERALASLRTP